MARIRTIKPELWVVQGQGKQTADLWLYCISEAGCEETGPCKIGIATNMPKRLSSLQGGNWRPLSLIWQVRLFDRDRAKNVEQHCLIGFRPSVYSVTDKQRLQSEWLEAEPRRVLAMALKYVSADDGVPSKVA